MAQSDISGPHFRSPYNVTLLGAGDCDAATLAQCLALAPVLVAADGGASRALAADHMPQAVFGDFDSIDAAAKAAIPADRLFPSADQETTDFEKSLAAIAAPLILATGFLGARVDHQLAAFNAIARSRAQCILVGAQDVCFHAQGGRDYLLPSTPGERVSLFPMQQVRGQSDGLRWPIAGLTFAPAGRIGTSNMATGPMVRLAFEGGGMIVVMPRHRLADLVGALGG